MFYFYSNGKLVSQSNNFSEIFEDFLNMVLYLRLPVFDGFYEFILDNCIKNLLTISGFWFHSNDCELSILTDLENIKHGS